MAQGVGSDFNSKCHQKQKNKNKTTKQKDAEV
jgi:hypothetical protein